MYFGVIVPLFLREGVAMIYARGAQYALGCILFQAFLGWSEKNVEGDIVRFVFKVSVALDIILSHFFCYC